MSVVVDFEEARHHARHERLLRQLLDDSTVDGLLALRSRKNYHLIARVSGIILGSLVAVPLEGKNERVVQVLSVAVDPRQRHHGIGRSMLKALVDEARREYHRYVIAPGPSAAFEALEWTRMQAPTDGSAHIENLQDVALTPDAWWSKPTRSLDIRMLKRLAEPEGLIRLPIVVRDQVGPTSGPIR